MIIDIEYIKIILKEFQDSKTAYINSSIFKNYCNENEEKFLFHWEILQDKFFVTGVNGEVKQIIMEVINGIGIIGGIKLRLTDRGHYFYDGLQEESILNKLKKDFKTSSMETLISISKKMLEKKLESVMDLKD